MSNGHPPGPWHAGRHSIDEGTLALTQTPEPGPVGDTAPDRDSRPGETDVPFDWKALGFTSAPRVVIADGRRLFRVWGGTSLERGDPGSRGVFFSFQCPASQREAERLFAIAEFGNACTFVTEFDVLPGTLMFVGSVDPGDDVHPSLEGAGEQVFIRNPWARRLVRVGSASRLERDTGGAWIYSGPKTREPEKGTKDGWN